MVTTNTPLAPVEMYTMWEGNLEQLMATRDNSSMYIVPDMDLLPVTEDMEVYSREYIEKEYPEWLI